MKDPGPGVHVVVHAEPLRAGRAVAEALGAQLITLPAMAESVVERLAALPATRHADERLARAEALSASLAGTDPQAERVVAEGATDLEHLADRVVLDDALARELRRRAAELDALEGLVERTARLHLGPTFDHRPPVPPGLRAAAAAVVAEEAAVADARCSLALADVLRSVTPSPPPAEEPLDEPAPIEPVPEAEPEAVEGPADADEAERPDDDGPPEVEPEHEAEPEPTAEDLDVPLVEADDDGPPTEALPILFLDAVDVDVPDEPTRPASPDDLDEEEVPAEPFASPGYDGSVMMPLGIFLVGLTIACALVLMHFSLAAGAIALATFLLIAALVRYSITSERRNAAHRDQAREALENAVTQGPERVDPGLLKPAAHDDPLDQAAVDDAPSPADEPPRLLDLDLDVANPAPEPGPTVADDDEELTVTAPGRVDEGERDRRAQVLAGALARLGAARDAWEAIAEADTDPATIEARFTGGPTDAAVPPAVRATRTVLAEYRNTWRQTWEQLGRTAPPPDDAVVDLLIADLHETAPDPAEAQLALAHRPAILERQAAHAELGELLGGGDLDDLRAGLPDADVIDDQPVVLVEPFHDLSRRRREGLRTMLDDLPDDLTVVVIVQSAKHVPAGAAKTTA